MIQDLKPIRVFLKVAELSSFAGAARSLGMTPASVTRIVAALEAELGQQLLLRTTRQVSLTSAGALVAARFRPVVQHFDDVTAGLTRASLPDAGHLTINAPVSMGLRLMPDLIVAFRAAYPAITVDVKMTDALVDIMADTCDLAVRVSSAPKDLSTIWRKICEVPLSVVAAPSLLDRVGHPQDPRDLDAALCPSYTATDAPEVWEFRKGSAKRTQRAGSAVMSNNGDFLYELALSGGGFVILPDFIVNRGIAEGRVVRVLPDWDVPSLWLTLYYPPYEQLPPLVATFSQFFESYMARIDGLEFPPLLR